MLLLLHFLNTIISAFNKKNYYVFIVALIIFTSNLYSQITFQPKFQRFDFENYNVKNYASATPCKNGGIFIVTDVGIGIFNGQYVKYILKGYGNDSVLLSKQVHTIYEDNKGNLWFGYENVGALSTIDVTTKKITHFKHDTANKKSFPDCIPAAYYEIGDKGEMYITTWGGGLIKFNKERTNFEIINVKSKPKDAKYWFETDVTRKMLHLQGDEYLIINFQEDNSRKMLPIIYNIKTNTARPFITNEFDKTTNINELNTILRNITICHFVYKDKNENFWFGTYSGLVFLDFKNKVAKRISSKKYTIGEYVNLDNVLNYTFDDKGNMWCGTANSGILIVNMTTHKTLSHVNNLDDYTTISNNNVRFINTDKLGNIWVFTGNNYFHVFFKYSQNFIFRTWGSLNVENTDASSRIVPIEQMNSDNKGNLYMANKYGVSVYSTVKDSNLSPIHFNHPADKNTFQSALNRFKIYNNKLYCLAHTKLNSSELFMVGYDLKTNKQIYQGSKSYPIWEFLFKHDTTSELYGQVFRYENFSKFNFNTNKFDTLYELKKKNSTYYNLSINLGNNKFLFSNGKLGNFPSGLTLLDLKNKKETLFQSHDSADVKLPLLKIFATTHNHKNLIWIATHKGIYEIDYNKLTVNYKNKDFGLDTIPITNVIKVNQNILWFTSPTKIYSYNFDTKLLNTFDKKQNFQFESINVNTHFDEPTFDDKYIYLATIRGLVMVDYKNNQLPSNTPTINCFNLIVNDSIRTDEFFENLISGKTKLSSKENNLSFLFASSDIVNPSPDKYEYKLLEIDTTWKNNEFSNKISFQNLNSGNYTLQVRCINAYGITSKVCQINFTINKPFYKTWWFIILNIIILISTVYLFIKKREQNLILKQQKLEKVIEERTSEIQEKAKEVEHQKHIVEEKQKEIIDSILYARRIQNALLATKTLLDKNLQNYFVYFNPKDIVSGDFYWATNQNNKFYLIIADSTGHGVPGAFMSLLNISYLNEAINEKQIQQPSEILNYIRNRLINSLAEDGSKDGGKDGMDCSLLCFDFEENTLEFACAYNPILLIRNGELIEQASDRMPVGNGHKNDVSFTNTKIHLQKGDIIYAFTDGYADQFGGESGKKLKYKNFKNYILQNTNLDLNQQHKKLENSFNSWKGSIEQVDDVLVIGIKV